LKYEGNTLAAVFGFSHDFLGQLAFAASRRGVPLLWAVLVQMAAITPQAARRLLAIYPDVAKFLAVIALCKGTLGFVCLNFYSDVSE
jgi:hypothetical protein